MKPNLCPNEVCEIFTSPPVQALTLHKGICKEYLIIYRHERRLHGYTSSLHSKPSQIPPLQPGLRGLGAFFCRHQRSGDE